MAKVLRCDDAVEALTHKQLVEELYSKKCHCGRRKAAGATFCRGCVAKLPMELYRGLLDANGYKYDSAYLVAIGHLDGLARLKRQRRKAV